MAKVKNVRCPHCDKSVSFKQNASGKWVGTIAGGGAGWVVASGLGIAGGILGALPYPLHL